MNKKIKRNSRPTYKRPGNNQVAQFDGLLRKQVAVFAANYPDGKIPDEVEVADAQGAKQKKSAYVQIVEDAAVEFAKIKRHKTLDEGLMKWALKKDLDGADAVGWQGRPVQDVWVEDGVQRASRDLKKQVAFVTASKKNDGAQKDPKDLRNRISARTDIDDPKKEKINAALKPTSEWQIVQKQDNDRKYEKEYYVRVRMDADNKPIIEKQDIGLGDKIWMGLKSGGLLGLYLFGLPKIPFVEKGDKIYETETDVELGTTAEFDEHLKAVALKKAASSTNKPPANVNTTVKPPVSNSNTGTNVNAAANTSQSNSLTQEQGQQLVDKYNTAGEALDKAIARANKVQAACKDKSGSLCDDFFSTIETPNDVYKQSMEDLKKEASPVKRIIAATAVSEAYAKALNDASSQFENGGADQPSLINPAGPSNSLPGQPVR